MSELVQALQDALAAEHAAVWSYEVLGGQTSWAETPQLARTLTRVYRTHRERRDTLVHAIRSHGADPVAAAVAYDLPGSTDSPRAVRATARTVEQRISRVYAHLVAYSTGSRRRWAVTVLGDTAVLEVELGAEPEPFPGLSER